MALVISFLLIVLSSSDLGWGQYQATEVIARWGKLTQSDPHQNLIIDCSQHKYKSDSDWQKEDLNIFRLGAWWRFSSKVLRHYEGERSYLSGVLYTDQVLIQFNDLSSHDTKIPTGEYQRKIESHKDTYIANCQFIAPWLDMLPIPSPSIWSATMLESRQMMGEVLPETGVFRVKSIHEKYELICDFELEKRHTPIRFEMRALPGYLFGGVPLENEFRWVFDDAVFEEVTSVFPCQYSARTISNGKKISQSDVLVKAVKFAAGLSKNDFTAALPINDGDPVQAKDMMHIPCEWRNGRIQPVNPGKLGFADAASFLSPDWWGKVLLIATVVLLLSTFVAIYLKNRKQTS